MNIEDKLPKAEQAARIAELEKRYEELSGALRFKHNEWEELQSKLSQLEKERDEFALEFYRWRCYTKKYFTRGTLEEKLEQFKSTRK